MGITVKARRGWAAIGLVLACLALQAGGRTAATETPRAPLVERVAAVGITVGNLDRAVAFFRDVLIFEPLAQAEFGGAAYERLTGVESARARRARLRLGEEIVELTEYQTPTGRPLPAESRSNDLWFQHLAIVVSDMDRAHARLVAHGVAPISTAPQRIPDWNAAAGGIRAFYFRDPDGHALELIWFPAGKGDPRWQEADGRLFLGIDHTAIAIADTAASLRFYRDVLGLTVAGESLNYGPEQEGLSNVHGARVRITSLRAPRGPGIEFLEYLEPRDGRARPADTRANDLVHWQTVLETTDVARAAAALRAADFGFVSPGVVEAEAPGAGLAAGALVRDPDGHAVAVLEVAP